MPTSRLLQSTTLPSPEVQNRPPDLQKNSISDHGLDYIAEITTGGSYVPDAGLNPAAHFGTFERKLPQALELDPLFVNCLAGSDLWSFRDNIYFLQRAMELATRNGVTIAFETHRSRSTFHPLITQRLLEEMPDLQLTIDFSHWCCVCERLVLDELPDILELCANHAKHIHARIGYDQGPQVPDPRAPEFAAACAHTKSGGIGSWDGMTATGNLMRYHDTGIWTGRLFTFRTVHTASGGRSLGVEQVDWTEAEGAF